MNRAFPALRGIAILLVILNHAVTLSLEFGKQHQFIRADGIEKIILLGLKQFGLVAVPIFLLLSGAFLAYAIQGKSLTAAYKIIASGLKFILVPYVIWSLVFYAVAALILDEGVSPLGIIRNLLIGYPNNFVPLLVFFYLLAPFLLRLLQRFPWTALAGIALYQLFSAAALNPLIFGVTLPAWTRFLTLPVLRITIAVWGIFFPLGIAYGLHAKAFTPFLQKMWRWFTIAAGLIYSFAVLNQLGIINFALADLLFPVTVACIVLIIQRNQIPAAAWFERLGKRAYGLYLINLILIQLTLWGLNRLIPGFFGMYWLAALLAFLVALWLPFTAINILERAWPQGRTTLRYIFG